MKSHFWLQPAAKNLYFVALIRHIDRRYDSIARLVAAFFARFRRQSDFSYTLLDNEDTKLESVFDSAEYREFKKRVAPADYIRTYRENAGLTQTALAEKLKVSRAYICDIEHGRRDISKQFAKQVANLFKISIAHLI